MQKIPIFSCSRVSAVDVARDRFRLLLYASTCPSYATSGARLQTRWFPLAVPDVCQIDRKDLLDYSCHLQVCDLVDTLILGTLFCVEPFRALAQACCSRFRLEASCELYRDNSHPTLFETSLQSLVISIACPNSFTSSHRVLQFPRHGGHQRHLDASDG